MDTQKRVIIWVSAALVLAISAIAVWEVATGAPETHATYGKTGTLTEDISASDWQRGNTHATVTLVEYGDFQCPACGAYYPLVEKVTAEYKDKVLFVFREFPLKQHQNALPSAYAAEAAGNQGKFWGMYQKIYEAQADWSDSIAAATTFEKYAKDLNLDMSKFKADVSAQATKDAVQHDLSTGLASGVDGTPSFFLNGKRMQNPQSYTEFKALLDYAIAHS